jgi:argininosuccinate lyase
MAQTWGGRFRDRTDEALRSINDSLPFDHRLIHQDVEASIAHARMLGRTGILAGSEATDLVRGLEEIRRDVDAGLRIEGAEDVHSWVECELVRRLGPLGGKLHTARSRNDQVATDLRLFLRDELCSVHDAIGALARTFVDRAEETLDVVLPAYTHLQRAQPVLLAHHLLAYVEMLSRDAGRILDALDRMDECPLGAGAATGTGFPIDREGTASELGFSGACRNSLDAVGSRDAALEALAALAILMTTLSRVSEELVLWSTEEFGFVRLPDAVTTGSSIMPQKRNPDGAELVRAKTARVTGHLTALLGVVRGLPLAYNKDLQEDKEGLFDAVDTARMALAVLHRTIEEMEFRAERMEAACRGGFLLATELADALTRKGMPFREAHEAVGRIVLLAEERGVDLPDLDPEAMRSVCPEADAEVAEALDVRKAIESRDHVGGTAPARVKAEIAAWRDRLGEASPD